MSVPLVSGWGFYRVSSVTGRAASDSVCDPAARSGRLDDDLPRLVESVRRYCRSRTASEVDAEDAAQSTFVRFFERPRDVENPEAWLIQAASFECRDAHRRRARDAKVVAAEQEAPVAVADPGVDPERLVAEKLLVEDLMRSLQPRDRELLALRYLSDYSVDQLARRLRVSEGNARIMALRARRRAHDALRTWEGGAAAIGLLGLIRYGRRLRRTVTRASGDAMARLETGLGGDFQAGMLQLTGPEHAIVPAIVAAFLVGGVAANLTPSSPRSPVALVSVSADPAQLAQASPGANRAGQSATNRGADPGSPLHSLAPANTSQIAGQVLTPGAGAKQQDAGFNSVTPSPSYSSDHTAFAAGSLATGCVGSCTAIFVTHDAGRSWAPLIVGSSYSGGAVVLPPDYPSDPVLMVDGSTGLERSDDGGHTFSPALPEASWVPAAANPDSPAGDPQVILGSPALTVYHVATRVVTPGPALPAGITRIGQITFVDTDTMLLTGNRADPAAPDQEDGVVVRCSPACSVVASFPGTTGWSTAIPAVGRTHTVAVFSGNQLAVSRDGGATFSPATTLPYQTQTAAIAPGAAGTATILVAPVRQAGVAAPALLSSNDSGGSFTAMPAAGLPATVSMGEVLALPDGHLLAALVRPDSSGDLGVRCSGDGGANWRVAC